MKFKQHISTPTTLLSSLDPNHLISLRNRQFHIRYVIASELFPLLPLLTCSSLNPQSLSTATNQCQKMRMKPRPMIWTVLMVSSHLAMGVPSLPHFMIAHALPPNLLRLPRGLSLNVLHQNHGHSAPHMVAVTAFTNHNHDQGHPLVLTEAKI